MLSRRVYLSSFVEGIITWIATTIFWGTYPLLTIVFLLLASVFLRLVFDTDTRYVVGGFLAGVFTNAVVAYFTLQEERYISEMIIVLFLIFILEFLSYFAKGISEPKPAYRQRFLFVFLGIMVFYAAQVSKCQIHPLPDSLIDLIIKVDNCNFSYIAREMPDVRNVQTQIQFYKADFQRLVPTFAEIGEEFVAFTFKASMSWFVTWGILSASIRQVILVQHYMTKGIHNRVAHLLSNITYKLKRIIRKIARSMLLMTHLVLLVNFITPPGTASKIFGMPLLKSLHQSGYFDLYDYTLIEVFRVGGIFVTCWLVAFFVGDGD
jgi:hypothetical protein